MRPYQPAFTLAAFVMIIALAPSASAQNGGTQAGGNTSSSNTRTVPSGQKMTIKGVVTRRDADTFVVQDANGVETTVTLNDRTSVKTNGGFLRGGTNYGVTAILRGLNLEVEGVGDGTNLVAQKIRFDERDLRTARAVTSNVVPVENRVGAAENRIGQIEQNSQRLLGQLDELAAISNAARGGSKAAQETADEAVAGVSATNLRIDDLQKTTSKAVANVKDTNERINALEKEVRSGQRTDGEQSEVAVLRAEVARLNGMVQSGPASSSKAVESPAASLDPDAAFDLEYKRLSPGLIVFDPPPRMRVGDLERVTVRIAKALTPEVVAGLRDSRTTESLPSVGTTMKVQLKGEGDNFDITPLDSEEQGVSDTGFTEWSFNVLPKHFGTHKLYIVAVVVVRVGNGEKVKDYPNYTKPVEVQVNPIYSTVKFGRDNWPSISSAVIGSGIIGGLIAWWRKKRKKDEPPPWENA